MPDDESDQYIIHLTEEKHAESMYTAFAIKNIAICYSESTSEIVLTFFILIMAILFCSEHSFGPGKGSFHYYMVFKLNWYS